MLRVIGRGKLGTGAAVLKGDTFPFCWLGNGICEIGVWKTDIAERAGPPGDCQVAFSFFVMI